MTQARALLERLLAGEDLGYDGAGALMGVLVAPDLPDALKAGLLVALRAKGETADEVRGLAMAMRAAAVPVPLPPGLRAVDTCGTGGDGSGSFNVSTAAALLVAAAGVPVVKHGNRSVSSRCGSADLIEALGLSLTCDPAEAARRVGEHGFTFLFAPAFHPATAAVVPTRRALGVRTVFNVLGPLTNPAAPPFQLVGAYDPEAARRMAAALAGMPVERAFVVHGYGGWDEATPCGPFLRLDVREGRVEETVIDPAERYGLRRCDASALAGGDAVVNAALLRRIFEGERSPLRDAVVLNAALVFELVGAEPDAAAARERAEAVLDSGRAARFLGEVVA